MSLLTPHFWWCKSPWGFERREACIIFILSSKEWVRLKLQRMSATNSIFYINLVWRRKGSNLALSAPKTFAQPQGYWGHDYTYKKRKWVSLHIRSLKLPNAWHFVLISNQLKALLTYFCCNGKLNLLSSEWN